MRGSVIDRNASLLKLEHYSSEVQSSTRVFDGDGDIEDEGAFEHLSEIDSVISALKDGESDSAILEIAEGLGLTDYIITTTLQS
jgi:hypothetical protein